jgi:hypothetical protein
MRCELTPTAPNNFLRQELAKFYTEGSEEYREAVFVLEEEVNAPPPSPETTPQPSRRQSLVDLWEDARGEVKSEGKKKRFNYIALFNIWVLKRTITTFLNHRRQDRLVRWTKNCHDSATASIEAIISIYKRFFYHLPNQRGE